MDDFFSDDGLDDLNDTALQELEDNAIQFTQAQHAFNTHHHPQQGGIAAGAPSQIENFEFEGDDLDDTLVFDELARVPAKPLPVQQQARVVVSATAGPGATAQSSRSKWNPQPQTAAGATAQQPHHNSRTNPTVPLSNRPRYPGPGPSQAPAALGPSAGNRAVPFHRPPPPPRPVPPQHGRPSQFSAPAPPTPAHPQPTQLQLQHQSPPQQQDGGGAGASGDIIATLQARLLSMQKDLNSAKGEAALLRGKYVDAQARHDAEVARLKNMAAEQLAKQARVAEQAIAAEKTAATELHFARQDLRDMRGRDRGRGGRKKAEREKEREGSGVTTPRKGAAAAAAAAAGGAKSSWGVADGFDDNELVASPSKGAMRRGKEGAAGASDALVLPAAVEKTPTKAKRKRPVMDSPLLELETDDFGVGGGPAPRSQASVRDGPVGVSGGGGGGKFRGDALPFDFLTLVLDHSALHTQPLTFDLFARYSFPSDPSLTFASFIFSRLHSLGSPHDPFRLLSDFCHLIIEMWAQCLHERYYTPILDLVSLVAFTLQLQTVAVAPRIIAYLLPIAQATVDLLAIPAFKSADGDLSNSADEVVQQLLAAEVNTTAVLALMHLTALGCVAAPSDAATTTTTATSADENDKKGATASSSSSSSSPLAQFWGMIAPEFVVTMLSPKQRPDDFLGMLALLRTSVLPSSVGPITTNEDPSRGVEAVAGVLVDRISYFLSDPPRWAIPGSWRQCEAKLAALETLVAFARSPFGLVKLVRSEHVIPRLVAALCSAVDMLYDMDIPASFLESGAEKGEKGGSPPSGSRMGALQRRREEGQEQEQELMQQQQQQQQEHGDPMDVDPNATQDAEPGGGDAVAMGDDEDPSASSWGVAARRQPRPESPSQQDLDSRPPPPRLLHALISVSVLLLHTLVTTASADDGGNGAGAAATGSSGGGGNGAGGGGAGVGGGGGSSVAAKLSASHGGAQRYLLTLARLNFAEEDLVLEAGVDAETAELANELLELAVTPDEGEGVRDVFGFDDA